MRSQSTLLLAMVLMGTASLSHAQGVYVTGSTSVDFRPSGWYPSQSTPSAPGASAIPSINAGVGFWVRPELAIEGGLTIAKSQSIDWRFSYISSENAEELTRDRDIPLTALIRIAPGRREAISIEPVFGAGLNWHRGTTYMTADCGPGSQPTPCVPVMPTQLPDVHTTASLVAVLGVDFAFRVAPRLSLAPGVRASFRRRDV